ncbi:MAG: hypothetical protein HGA54_00865 [Actinobacteria bacterium]|nr:hypothetical protein [Actinomycetota bacterium]
MNNYQSALMDKPSITLSYCAICGVPANNDHHVVPRSQGGADGPVITLCGGGCSGHHGMAHEHTLHFRYITCWQYLKTDKPVKYEVALEMEGWQVLWA